MASITHGPGLGGFDTYVLTDGDASVRVAPARGALVSSFCVGGEEVLWLDEATYVDVSKNVRGGVPLLFPNAGPLPDGRWGGGALPQHGFARTQRFSVGSAVADDAMARLELVLASSDVTRAGYDFAFEATYALSLYEGKLLLEFALLNSGPTRLPWHFGLHPYFAVTDKTRARVPTQATRAWNNVSKVDEPFVAPRFGDGEVDLHLLDHGQSQARLVRGDGTAVVVKGTPEFDTWVLWTLPNRPFICLEPWTAPTGALASGHGLRWVEPGAKQAVAVELSVERRSL